MEETVPDMGTSCEYNEYAITDSRQGVVLLQLADWAKSSP
jgi:hypothetical protein